MLPTTLSILPQYFSVLLHIIQSCLFTPRLWELNTLQLKVKHMQTHKHATSSENNLAKRHWTKLCPTQVRHFSVSPQTLNEDVFQPVLCLCRCFLQHMLWHWWSCFPVALVLRFMSFPELKSWALSSRGATVHNNYATALQKPYISPHLKVSTSLCSMPAEEVSASIEMHKGHYCPRGSHDPSWSTGGAGVKRAHPSFLRAPLSCVRLSQVLRWTLLLKSWPVSRTSFSRAVRLPLQETEISNFCDILLCNESVKGKWKGGDAP